MALITCPECKHQVSEHAVVCPQCGFKLNILTAKLIKFNEQQGRASLPNAKRILRSSIFAVLGILVVAFVGAAFWASLGQKAPETVPSNVKNNIPMPGDIASIRVPGGEDVPVAISKEALGRLTKLSVANDTTGISQMILAGLVWTVPSGTKCLLIDPGVLTYEVRIMEGRHTGSSCFVARDFIVRK